MKFQSSQVPRAVVKTKKSGATPSFTSKSFNVVYIASSLKQQKSKYKNVRITNFDFYLILICVFISGQDQIWIQPPAEPPINSVPSELNNKHLISSFVPSNASNTGLTTKEWDSTDHSKVWPLISLNNGFGPSNSNLKCLIPDSPNAMSKSLSFGWRQLLEHKNSLFVT